MNPGIPGEFGMKARGNEIPVSNRHDPTCGGSCADPANHFDSCTDFLDPGRPNEDTRERATINALEVNATLKGVDLTSEGITADSHVDSADGLLIRAPVKNAISEQDHPRA
jgi:hypothetical protein